MARKLVVTVLLFERLKLVVLTVFLNHRPLTIDLYLVLPYQLVVVQVHLIVAQLLNQLFVDSVPLLMQFENLVLVIYQLLPIFLNLVQLFAHLLFHHQKHLILQLVQIIYSVPFVLVC
ncbi:MAG: hypothetical protein CMF74_18225 [Maricaulis sp.]|nr:hypothetical protein [Maricaulis sp.]